MPVLKIWNGASWSEIAPAVAPAQYTDDILNVSAVPGTTATDALNDVRRTVDVVAGTTVPSSLSWQDLYAVTLPQVEATAGKFVELVSYGVILQGSGANQTIDISCRIAGTNPSGAPIDVQVCDFNTSPTIPSAFVFSRAYFFRAVFPITDSGGIYGTSPYIRFIWVDPLTSGASTIGGWQNSAGSGFSGFGYTSTSTSWDPSEDITFGLSVKFSAVNANFSMSRIFGYTLR